MPSLPAAFSYSLRVVNQGGAFPNVAALRRNCDWWRAQRLGQCRLPGEGWEKSARFGAAARAWRGSGYRRNYSRIFVFGVLVRGFVAAAGDYSGAGSAAARAGDFAVGRDVYSDGQRRPPLADERPCARAARDSAAFAIGRGSV